MMRLAVFMVLLLSTTACASQITIGLYFDSDGTAQCVSEGLLQQHEVYLIASSDTSFACLGWELSFHADPNLILGIDTYNNSGLVVDDFPSMQVGLESPLFSDSNHQVLLAQGAIVAILEGGVYLEAHESPSVESEYPLLAIGSAGNLVGAIPDTLSSGYSCIVVESACSEGLGGGSVEELGDSGNIAAGVQLLDPPYSSTHTADYDTLYINGVPHMSFEELPPIVDPSKTELSYAERCALIRKMEPAEEGGSVKSYCSRHQDELNPFLIDRYSVIQMDKRADRMATRLECIQDVLGRGGLFIFDGDTCRLVPPPSSTIWLDVLSEMRSNNKASAKSSMERAEADYGVKFPGFMYKYIEGVE